MPIKVVCDICGEPHKVGENRIGAKMRCRACEATVKVPRGPFVDEDEELLDDEENEEDEAPREESEFNVLGIVRDGAGAILGLFLMGCYVTYTINYLSGAEGATRSSWSKSSGGHNGPAPSPSGTNRAGMNRPRPNVPNVPQPNVPQPNVPQPGFPDPNASRTPDPADPFSNDPFPNRPDPFANDPFPSRRGRFPGRPTMPRPTFPRPPNFPDRPAPFPER